MKTTWIASTLLLALAGPLPALAQSASARSLAATCANCHGTNGRSVTTDVTSLAGLPKTFIIQRMKEFQEGKRPATVMHQLARGYTDAQIEELGAFFEAASARR